MKNELILCVVVLLCSLHINAQTYVPLIDENRFWEIAEYSINFCQDDPSNVCHYYRLYFEGDSVINGLNYSLLQARELTPTSIGGPDFILGEAEFSGFMREDLVTERIYGLQISSRFFPAFDCNSSDEQLIFDFMLTATDSLDACYHADSPIPVSSVETIDLPQGGPTRKQITFQYDFMPTLTEGIGGSAGMCVPFSAEFETNWYVRCVSENGAEVLGACGNIVSSSRDTPSLNQHIQIAPNPVSTWLNVSLTDLKPSASFEVVVYSATGKMIAKSKQDAPNFQLSVDALSKGVYWLEVRSGEQMGARKFVKL